MLKIYFTIINKKGEKEIFSQTKEGTPDEVGKYASDYANEYLHKSDEIETIEWEVLQPLNGGALSKKPNYNGWS